MQKIMKSLTKSALALVLTIILIAAFAAYTSSPKDVEFEISENLALTIYNSGLATVADTRTESLDKGQNIIHFTGIPKSIIPQSAQITDQTDSDTRIIEQEYSYDLLTAQSLMQRYEGDEVTIITRTPEKETITGRLLKYESGKAIIEGQDGAIHIIESSEAILPELPEGLATTPTISWLAESQRTGNHTLMITYMTEGISWTADYIAEIDEDQKKTSLSAWVTIDNNAGTDFEGAKIKLVAGDINRVTQSPIYAAEADEVKTISAGGFTEEQLFEYHSYTLDRKATIPEKTTKQLQLFESDDIPITEEYIFDPERRFYWETDTETRVKTMVTFTNSEQSGLGIPMPEGIVRVYKQANENTIDFIGEDTISHTPEGEEIRLFLGYAFDITADRKKTRITRISEDVTEETYEVTVTNRKEEPITVTIVEHPYGDWEIIETSEEYEIISVTQAEWDISIPKDTKKTLTYTIRYRT